MTLDEFMKSLDADAPPEGCAPALVALWHARRKDWERAHQVAQEIPSPDGSWVHAHLHRVEGDLGNADYWYRRSGRARPECGIEEEWRTIVEALL